MMPCLALYHWWRIWCVSMRLRPAGIGIAMLVSSHVVPLGTPVLMSVGVGGIFILNALGRNGVVDFCKNQVPFPQEYSGKKPVLRRPGKWMAQWVRALAAQAWGSESKCRVPTEKKAGVAPYPCSPSAGRDADKRLWGLPVTSLTAGVMRCLISRELKQRVT